MLSNGPAEKQAEKQWPAAIASVTFQALISRIGFPVFWEAGWDIDRWFTLKSGQAVNVDIPVKPIGFMLGWVLFLFLIGTKYKITRVSVPIAARHEFPEAKNSANKPRFPYTKSTQ